MSIKDLFSKKGTPKIQKTVSTGDLVDQVESSDFVEAKRKQFDQFVPPIDFTTASNFAKFGSAELYYEKAFERIHQYYPYDGTLHEKIEFENSSSYFDKYVFDTLYPRTNGYMNFIGSAYITVDGGPHTASAGMIGKTLDSTFDNSMIYNESKKRTNAFEFRVEDGITTEFWFKAPNNTDIKTILHISGSDSNGEIKITQDTSNIKLFIASGSFGGAPTGLHENIATVTDTDWNYYAVTAVSSSDGITVKGFKNGKLSYQKTTSGASYNYGNILPNVGGLNARIGQNFSNGEQLTGSLDEFRFWKTVRTPEDIYNTWFIPLGGGTNKHDANIGLSCYFKFNEGITGIESLDTTVLDYSGRINNGLIQNYATTLRKTDSAITEKLGEPEFLDPIIYSSHPDVISKKAEYKASGSHADLENSSTFFNYFPAWMQEEDEQGGNQLKFLSQVLGSYLDTLWHQIGFINKIHDHHYISGSNKALPFAKKLLYDQGFVMPDLFVDATKFENFRQKDDNEVFEKEINEVRNIIYHNIYNNLNSIQKSKGTEKAFRNFFRSVGIGQDVVKLKMYADDSTFVLRNNYEYKSYERKFLDFNVNGHSDGTIYQTTSSNNSNVYIPGDKNFTGSFTLQAEIILPRKQRSNEPNYNPYPYLTASIAGYHTSDNATDPYTGPAATATLTIPKEDSGQIGSESPVALDISAINSNELTIRDAEGTSTVLTFDNTTTSHTSNKIGIQGVTTQVNLKNRIIASINANVPKVTAGSVVAGVRAQQDIPLTQDVSGPGGNGGISLTNTNAMGTRLLISNFSGGQDLGLQVFVVHSSSEGSLNPDDKQRVKFVLTGSNINLETPFFTQQYENNKWSIATRLKHSTYPRPNITGSTKDDYLLEFYGVEADGNTERNSFLLSTSSIAHTYYSSDKIFYAGAHNTNFTGSTLQHTDVKLGYLRYWHSYLSNDTIKQHAFDSETFGANEPFEQDLVDVYPLEIPREKTLALHWAFHDLTASNPAGEFNVTDLSSGSSDSNYGTLSNTIQRTVAARGINFNNSTSAIVDTNFLYSARKRLPDDLMSSDLTTIKTDETEQFFVDEDVSDNFYSFEKSMWGTISDEMMSIFSTALDLNNLIGQPNQRYHHRYGLADFLRDRFFEDVENEPDIEKFTTFYKWIDDSISVALQQLVPASARFSEKINNIVESHVLERNKYVHQIPIVTNFESTEGSIKGISEMKYNWQFGHGVDIPRATATITTVAEASIVDTKDFTLTDPDGVTTTYNISTGLAISNNTDAYTPGGQDGKGPAGTITVGLLGATSREDVRDQIIARINAGTNIGFEAFTSGQNVLIVQGTAGSSGNKTNTDEGTGLTVGNFTGGDDNEQNHTLWHKDRRQKTGIRETLRNSRNNHSIQSSGLIRKEIDGSTRISDTYAVRKFAKTYDFSISSRDTIHGGTNFGRKKNLQLFHESVAPAGRMESVPQNIITVGVGVGSGIIQEPPNSDLSPIKKKYNLDVLVGNKAAEEYGYKLKGNFILPLNIMSGTVNSGYNFFIETSYSSGVYATNLHNDIVGNYNETSIQGPFTEQHVGGLQYRHIDLNLGTDTEATRPEGWRILLKDHAALGPDADGALGFVGPDYETPYPSPTQQKANRYRDEHAKRPLNIRNIKTTSTSQKVGNYRNELELFSVSPTFQKTWAVEAYNDPNVNILPTGISSILPDSTQYQTLIGRDPNTVGNVFGVMNNNRQIDSSLGSPFSLAINSAAATGNPLQLASDTSASGYSTTGNKSFSFWINLDTNDTSDVRYIAQLTSGTDNVILVYFQSGEFRFETTSTTGTKRFVWTVIMSDFVGEWNNFVIVWDGNQSNNPTWYVNGSSQGSPDSTVGSGTGTTLDTINRIYLFDRGTTSSVNFDLQGSLMNFGIWEAALTSGNATTIYNSGVALDAPILQGSLIDFYFLGNELTGFSIGDEIPNGTAIPSSFGSGNNDLTAQTGLTIVQGVDTQSRKLVDHITLSQSNVITIPRTDLTGSQRNIITRFSAPGGPEIQSIGYLDAYTSTYSVHNVVSFRNLSVLGSGSGEATTIRVEDHLGHRRGLKTLRALHMGQFGIDSQYGSITAENYPSNGSFNKQHRNRSRVHQFSTGELIITGSNHDNMHINSPIPRSELQYSWIHNATSGSNAPTQRILGYAPRDGIVSSSAGYVEAIVFPTSSTIIGS